MDSCHMPLTIRASGPSSNIDGPAVRRRRLAIPALMAVNSRSMDNDQHYCALTRFDESLFPRPDIDRLKADDVCERR